VNDLLTQALAVRLGHRFADPDLLLQALTHSSTGSPNYERLEHLGDAVLDLTVAAWLYRDFPHFGPGQMSILRAELVCAETLARLAQQLELPQALRLSDRADARGFRQRAGILSDALEAVAGAIFVDSRDLTAVDAFFLPLARPLADAVIRRESDFYHLVAELHLKDEGRPASPVIMPALVGHPGGAR
jgi:dsRNA-specific ribonuclease